MKEYQELLKNKTVQNSINEMRKSLNKRWFDIEFISTDIIGFKIVKKLD